MKKRNWCVFLFLGVQYSTEKFNDGLIHVPCFAICKILLVMFAEISNFVGDIFIHGSYI